jgi:hypothetical protein
MTGSAAARELWTVVLLAMWLGATAVVGAVVAPAAFAVLPSRSLAGALVGRVLPVLFWSGALLGVVSAALASPLARARRGRIACGATMTVACLVAQGLVTPRIERARVAAAGPVDALAPSDPRRIAFGRLHGLSVALLGIAGLGAAAGLLLSAGALTARTSITLRESHDHG